MATSDIDSLEVENARVYQNLGLVVESAELKNSGPGKLIGSSSFRKDATPPSTPLRLLVLRRGAIEEPIQCDLIVADLSSIPIYDALSYVWGDRQDLRLITCSGRPFAIRPNLYSALKYLRKKNEDVVLWTDAICINQADLVERSEQVGYMGRIYESARRVLVWLGEERQDDFAAFETVIELSKRLPKRRNATQPSDAEIDSYKAVNALNFRHLLHFFSRTWFERVWVIQEVVRAREATVISGRNSLSWDEFVRVVLSFNDAFGFLTTKYAQNRSATELIALENLPSINWLKKNHKTMSLFEILCIGSTFKSTDERDKLFAMLNLGNPTSVRIQPDYTSSYFDVFRKHIKLELTQRHRLHYLARPPVMWSADWPSWVPDWREKSRTSYFCTAPAHSFKASANTTPSLRISSDERVLSIQGRSVDIISYLVPPTDRFADAQSQQGSQSKDVLRWLEQCMACVGLYFDRIKSYADSALEPFLRTFACEGVHGHQKRGILRSIMPQHNDKAEFRQLLKQIASSVAPKYNPAARSVLLDQDPLTTLVSKLYPAIADRQFFKTVGGRVGWVSRRGRMGDVICVFHGADVPFVLRQLPDEMHCWRLIGECYTDGIMLGEAMFTNDPIECAFHIR